jgi:hypothetical protein
VRSFPPGILFLKIDALITWASVVSELASQREITTHREHFPSHRLALENWD